MSKAFTLPPDIDEMNLTAIKEQLTKWKIPFKSSDNKDSLTKKLKLFVDHHSSLYGLCYAGDFNAVELLLQSSSNTDINTIPRDIFSIGTPLAIAVFSGFVAIVELLLRNGANPDIKCKRSENFTNHSMASPLSLALRNRDVKIIELLLEFGADVNLKSGFYNKTPLNIVCSFFEIPNFPQYRLFPVERYVNLSPSVSDTDLIKLLLSRGANANLHSGNTITGINYDYSPLHEACRCKSLDVIKLLVESGAKVNAVDAFGQTALHKICYHNTLMPTMMTLDHLEGIDFDDKISEPILRYLISQGADVNARNLWNSWDRRYTYRSYSPKITPNEYRFCWSGETRDGEITPLHVACSAGMSRCVRVLLDNGSRFTHLGSCKYIGSSVYHPNLKKKEEVFLCVTRVGGKYKSEVRQSLCRSINSFIRYKDPDIHNLMMIIHSVQCTNNSQGTAAQKCLSIHGVLITITSYFYEKQRFPSRLSDADVKVLT